MVLSIRILKLHVLMKQHLLLIRILVKKKCESDLGSQDIPMILNTTPSVYATQQKRGGGDARINVRGFQPKKCCCDDRGVPQNDEKDGFIRSNWTKGDATSSIQMQKIYRC